MANRARSLTYALVSFPFIAICLAVPLWDRVQPMILGLPFNMFWLILCIPLTTLCLWGVYRLRPRESADKPKPDVRA